MCIFLITGLLVNLPKFPYSKNVCNYIVQMHKQTHCMSALPFMFICQQHLCRAVLSQRPHN